jgi:hypothetical protein
MGGRLQAADTKKLVLGAMLNVGGNDVFFFCYTHLCLFFSICPVHPSYCVCFEESVYGIFISYHAITPLALVFLALLLFTCLEKIVLTRNSVHLSLSAQEILGAIS